MVAQEEELDSNSSPPRRMIFTPEEKDVGLRQRRTKPSTTNNTTNTDGPGLSVHSSFDNTMGVASQGGGSQNKGSYDNGIIDPVQFLPLNDVHEQQQQQSEEKEAAATESTLATKEVTNVSQHSSLQQHQHQNQNQNDMQQQESHTTEADYFPTPSSFYQHNLPPPPKSTLYAYSHDSIAGRTLTKLSSIFIENKNETKSPLHKKNDDDDGGGGGNSSNNSSNKRLNNHDPTSPEIKTKITKHSDNIRAGSAFAGFLSLLLTTCASYMLSPMRDAAALAIGVSHIPLLTLASTILALASSVPMGWLFEAPNKERSGKSWRDKIGLTRGETQGTSLALFYRCFALCLVGYAFTFKVFELLGSNNEDKEEVEVEEDAEMIQEKNPALDILSKCGTIFYVAFFLVVHLMKLHSISLIWGVAQEAMEYEEQTELREQKREEMMSCNLGIEPTITNSNSSENLNGSSDQDKMNNSKSSNGGSGPKRSAVRLKRLAFVGFGGTLGGIIGSVFVSLTARTLRLSGLLVVAALLLLLSAELSIELGRIMFRHWEDGRHEELEKEKQREGIGANNNVVVVQLDTLNTINSKAVGANNRSCDIDPSLKRVSSVTGMKRVASGNTIMSQSSDCQIDASIRKVSSIGSMKRIASGNSISSIRRTRSSGTNLDTMDADNSDNKVGKNNNGSDGSSIVDQDLNNPTDEQEVDENTFRQRLARGVMTILRSRLLMTIFTYNALYATTTVLLSFQRAELVANRSSSNDGNNVDSDTAFLAKINMASSVAVFALQASGMGAFIASSCGQRGTLSLMPLVRLCGVALLELWHVKADGEPPNLMLFLVLDEFTKVINFAVAKPVRESLWSDLSNEARYEAKPIVDTLANRWGGGSAAFLMALLDKIMHYTGLGEVSEDGTKTLFGFPPLLFLCSISAAWWTFVSVDLGNIRHRIDLELKKQKEE